MDIERFKPDGTGKFSPLLYKWLKKNERHGVYLLNTDRFSGETTDGKPLRPFNIIIGHNYSDGYVGGNRLIEIIQKSVRHGWAFPVGNEVTDISDLFWAEYGRIGRCVWDGEHKVCMIGDDHRYNTRADGKSRVCNWCGAVHVAVERERVERWTEWLPATEPGGAA